MRQLGKVLDIHNCGRDSNVKMICTNFLSRRIQNALKDNPNMNIKEIKEKARRKWTIHVNKTKVVRKRCPFRDMVDGSFSKEYERFMTIVMKFYDQIMIKDDEFDKRLHFQRLYIC